MNQEKQSVTKDELHSEFKEFKQEVKEVITQSLADQSRDFRDFTRQEITAAERRLERKMDAMETRILDGVAETLSNFIYPKIDNHETRITTLEQKLA